MTTTAVLSQPISPTDQIMAEVLNVSIQTGVGALAGLVLGIVNPIGGAIFAATSGVARLVGKNIIDALPINEAAAKAALGVASFITSVGLGIMATTCAGFTITTLGAIGMTFIVITATLLVRAGGVIADAFTNANIQTQT